MLQALEQEFRCKPRRGPWWSRYFHTACGEEEWENSCWPRLSRRRGAPGPWLRLKTTASLSKELREAADRESWGRGKHLYFPRLGGAYSLAVGTLMEESPSCTSCSFYGFVTSRNAKTVLGRGFSPPMHTTSWKGSLLATSSPGPGNLPLIRARRSSRLRRAQLLPGSVCGVALQQVRGGSDAVCRDSPCWVSARGRASPLSSGRELRFLPQRLFW